MKNWQFLTMIVWLVVSVSCGSYKRTTSETDLNQKHSENTKTQTDKVIIETVETVIEAFDSPSIKDSLHLQKAKPKQWKYTQKKTTKTVDKGSIEKVADTQTNLALKETEKQNPWRPPWYASGLIVLVLLVVYKVFKTKFQIVKRI